MPGKVASPQVVSVADLRALAGRRLPRVAFDYIDGGADGEVTLRENCRAFEEVFLRPRSAVVTKGCSLRTTVLGTELALPVLLGPVGSCRMFWPRGEAEAARAAGAAGTVHALSTLSGTQLEEVKAASSGPCW
jgi:L-lactate dehydrogenase (cytochrome)